MRVEGDPNWYGFRTSMLIWTKAHARAVASLMTVVQSPMCDACARGERYSRPTRFDPLRPFGQRPGAPFDCGEWTAFVIICILSEVRDDRDPQARGDPGRRRRRLRAAVASVFAVLGVSLAAAQEIHFSPEGCHLARNGDLSELIA